MDIYYKKHKGIWYFATKHGDSWYEKRYKQIPYYRFKYFSDLFIKEFMMYSH